MHGETPSLTLADSVVFEGNTPQDFANTAGSITDARILGAVLPPDVGPFPPQRPAKATSSRKPEARIPTCRALAPEILVTDLTGHTECQRIGAPGVGRLDLIAAGIVDAVDVWSWVGQGTEVCFLAKGAAMVFIDSDSLPRRAELLPFSERAGYSCAKIPNRGSLALLSSVPGGMSQARSGLASAQTLTDCYVTLQARLNLRESPYGAVLRVLPASVRLTALERTTNWILVDYHGERGWVSANYVTPDGDCS